MGRETFKLHTVQSHCPHPKCVFNPMRQGCTSALHSSIAPASYDVVDHSQDMVPTMERILSENKALMAKAKGKAKYISMAMLKLTLLEKQVELRGNEKRTELMHRLYHLVKSVEDLDFSSDDITTDAGDNTADDADVCSETDDDADEPSDIGVEEPRDVGVEDIIVVYPDPDHDPEEEFDDKFSADNETTMEEEEEELLEGFVAQDIVEVKLTFAQRLDNFQSKTSHTDEELFVFREYLSDLSMKQLRSNVK